MPTTVNKDFNSLAPIPDGISPNTEVFYHPSTNEVFENYDDYFERMIQLNSSCWSCTMTGRNGLTYDEALQSEAEAMEQINNFPSFLETPILYLVHHYTCRARVDELNEEVLYRLSSKKRVPARIVSVNYHPPNDLQNGNKAPSTSVSESPLQNGVITKTKLSPAKSKSPKKESEQSTGLEICRPDCFTYSLQIIDKDSESDSDASSIIDDNKNGSDTKSLNRELITNITHQQIGRSKYSYATRPRIKLFTKYYTEMSDGHFVVKPNSVADFHLDQLRFEQLFADCPPPKFPQTRSFKKQKEDRISSFSGNDKLFPSTMKRLMEENYSRPSTSTQLPAINEKSSTSKKAGVSKAEIRRKRIIEQQMQLRPLFETADNLGVENIERWRQTFHVLSDEDIQELRNSIAIAKAAEKAELRKQQIEQRRKQRELLAEWKKPRDDLLCDDLQPFPSGYRELRWPDWVPRDLYRDILSVQSFFQNFAEVLFHDRKNPFTLTNIATAIVSRQTTENTQFYQILDWLMTAMNKSIEEDEGDPADLSKPEHIGNEAVKDFDHPTHGDFIRRINKECERQKRIHGVHIRALIRDSRDITEIIRLHLKTSGYYTQYRRQLRGFMHCYEDDGYIFSHSETEIMEVLKKSSIYALTSQQRIKLFNVLINQLLSHRRCRTLITKRTEEMNELKRELRHLKTVDQQIYFKHERESREAYQLLSQQKTGSAQESQASKVSKQLSNLRRALIQLNEGRRVQNISEIKERVLDEKNPLPWTQMENINEVLEFRAVQRNFHSDRVQELLQKIFELHGKMGLYFLGRDRAFRCYYYMCSTFIIQCPSKEECGKCEELTPNTIERPKQVSDDEEDDDIQILDSNDVIVSEKMENNKSIKNDVKPLENDGSNNISNKCLESLPNGDKLNNIEEKNHKDQNNEIDEEGFADVDPLMACTGKKDCPVHNPSSGQLLYYIERDAVKKLMDALNPRGFRESELFENISFFKEIYTKELNDFLDVWKDRHSVRPLSAKLFGFSSSIPKELGGGKEEVKIEESPSIGDALHRDMISHLLQLEEFVHERRFGSPHCTVDREKWRQALETDGDTTPFCVDNHVSVLHSTHSDILFTPSLLFGKEIFNLTPVEKLGVALIQLAQGVKLECLQSPFIHETKRNGLVIKRTPSQTFIDWQRALKYCQSPSAIALFATTFEYSVNWDYESPLEKEKKQKNNVNNNLVNSHNQPLANNNRARTVPVKPRREAQVLLADAADLLVSGPRQRRPVTKYGECEMDLDKIDFGDEKVSESEETDKETETEEEMENRILDDNDEIGESSEGDVEVRRGDFSDDEDEYLKSKKSRQRPHLHHFDGFGALRYEGLGRKRKAVTHFDPSNYAGTSGYSDDQGTSTSYGHRLDVEEFDNKNEGRGDNVDNEWLIDDDEQLNNEIGQQQRQPDEGILLEEWQQLG
uniref:WAC domain-containing protein n=1 Tax=Meloidogyne hapla TaxID=6305 RepID=A0A1I8B7F3_MELHA